MSKKPKCMTPRHFYLVSGYCTLIITVTLAMCGLNWLAAYFMSINAVTFYYYHYDKKQAIRHGNRVPEMVLHVLSLVGGSIGAILGQEILRHKTCKKSFKSLFTMIVTFQMMICFVIILQM